MNSREHPSSATAAEASRRRRGPAPLADAERRTHTVSVRMNDAEIAWLDAARAPTNMQRGEYLRAAAAGKLPPTIPAINAIAWRELARTAANLNQLAKEYNVGIDVSIAHLQHELAEFRRLLIDLGGAK